MIITSKIIIDCSHANSNKDHLLQSVAFRSVLNQRASGNTNIAGMMLEGNLNPGSQKLNEKDPSNLEYGVSITDPCIGWEDTEVLLSEAYDVLGQTSK